MTINDAALDKFSPDNVKLHPSAVYTFLFLFLGLRMYKSCWAPLFRHSSVNNSAKKIAFLKILIVVQSVCIGALVDDLIFQHVQEVVVFPKLPFLFIIFVGFICEIVFALTRSFRPTMEHAVLSHFVPFLLSIILHIGYLRPEPFNEEWEIISLYVASVLVVFWSDVRVATIWEKEALVTLGQVGKTVVLQTARSLESFGEGLSTLSEATTGFRTLTNSVVNSPILSLRSGSWNHEDGSNGSVNANRSSPSTATNSGSDGHSSSDDEGSSRGSVASSVSTEPPPVRRSARLAHVKRNVNYRS
ncbi:uncharacterized protein LOC129591964 isoform X1 [Paramacrobiotus metropolitanus]|uniref:uncharacterized protein LOC129591964 isoform X1 n=1 Tax=Paramacrobiotus metropolitanus TaxID=2943436 RepID=UPI0024463B62|nr:uncharacterized protein LOC129591964 isoform X1 [Paramacrobiotus metropolitanus]